ncbi:MAG: type II secretion system F family protein [Nocardioides sp.]|uniref:type II secretion system F family protein n=1 Tax=Nocardioides sp. TaxID=35761 RepID=UPI003F072883
MSVMHEFKYEAVNPASGEAVKGSMEAGSEGAVVSRLRAQGLTPVTVATVDKTGLNRDVRIPGFGNKVKLKSVAVFARQMAALTTAGLPLMRALQLVAEQTEDKVLAKGLAQVARDVEGGQSFSLALSHQPTVFPPLLTNVVRVGESGGFLSRALESVAVTYQKEVDLRGKVRSAMTYPAIIFVIAIVAMIGMVTFVVPVFEKMFSSMDAQLPLPTRILVGISHNMTWILPLLVVGLVVFGGWWRLNKHRDHVRKVKDGLLLRLPVFGPLLNKIAINRFARNLAMMLNAGVPILQALDIVRSVANNWPVEKAIEAISEGMRQGRSFTSPLADHPVFPSLVSQMVAVGEESGSLGAMLDNVADYYDMEIEQATESLSSAIEPLLMVFLGVVVGGMVIALYLPMFSLYDTMNSQG